jgi:hypothetical protein
MDESDAQVSAKNTATSRAQKSDFPRDAHFRRTTKKSFVGTNVETPNFVKSSPDVKKGFTNIQQREKAPRQ